MLISDPVVAARSGSLRSFPQPRTSLPGPGQVKQMLHAWMWSDPPVWMKPDVLILLRRAEELTLYLKGC